MKTDGYNKVTDEEMITFERIVKYKASEFLSKFATVSIKGTGWTVDDISQELRIAVWVALKNFSEEKRTTKKGYAKKETYVMNCMDNRLKLLARHLWADKRGFGESHYYNSQLLYGNWDTDL